MHHESCNFDQILGLDSVQGFGMTQDEDFNIQFQNTKETQNNEKTA